MLNLLPENKKQKIIKEYFLRKFIVILYFILFTVVVSFVSILPSYLVSRNLLVTRESEKKSLEYEIKKYESKDNGAENLALQNAKILLSGLTQEISKTDLIRSVLVNKNTLVSLKSFRIYKNGGDSVLVIEGKSATREGLIDFKKSLDANSLIDQVELPLSSLGPSTNNDFTITSRIKNI